IARDGQSPVVVEGVLLRIAIGGHAVDAAAHGSGDLDRVVDDDAVVATHRFAQAVDKKLVDALEIVGGFGKSGKDDGKLHIGIVRVHQDTEQIEDLFGGAHAAGKDNDGVAEAHEGFQAFF